MFSLSLLFLYCTVPFSTNHTAHATVIRLNHECIQYTAETETVTETVVNNLCTPKKNDVDIVRLGKRLEHDRFVGLRA